MDLKKHEPPKTNLVPRSYQNQLEEIAAAKNTLIHLPTGSGKTFIAIQLIARFRHDLKKPWGQGGKRTFFLVNTVPLAKQQQRMIKHRCPVEGVAAFTSEDAVDYWDKAKWDKELSQNQVIVMTSQILNDMLTHGYINIKDINLLIFDECHHAVDDHPMRVIMKKFEGCPPNMQPRILGLTATLLNGNVKISKVRETLRDLETTFHATIAKVDDLGEVLTYSTNPMEFIEYYVLPMQTNASIEATKLLTELQYLIMAVKLPVPSSTRDITLKKGQKNITSDPAKITKGVKNMVSSMMNHLNEMGVYGGAMTILAYIILLERLKRKASTKQEETFYKFCITHCVRARMILLEAMINETGYMKIVKHSSKRIIYLLNILKEYNPTTIAQQKGTFKYNKKRNHMSAIIFTQQRFTSKVLFNILKEVKEANPAEYGFIKHDFVVGFNVNPMNNTREDHYAKKLSQQALLKFANKDLNCLISTSVIEEGVDIPQCLLVVRYDPPLEYRSYIQSKGRARSQDASYIILVNAENETKFKSQFENFQTTEKYIYNLLFGNTDERAAPSQTDVDSMYDEDKIPPYITKNGNHLSSVSAISLLNRYCSTLPGDQFSAITAVWLLEHRNEKKVISVLMPITCPIKEVTEGDPYEDLKVAKRSAALKVCIKLHQIEELDSITLLPKQYAKVNFDSESIKACFPNWPWDEIENKNLPKAGTNRYVRKHKKEFPVCLNAPCDWRGSQLFALHVIKLKPAFPRPSDSRESALYDLLFKSEGYGFLTLKPLPKICSFPMFLTIGEVVTSFELNYAIIPLDEGVFDLIKKFHFFIFDQVLEVAKRFTVFDGVMNNLYVVPIVENDGYDIDWATMQKYKETIPTEPPSMEERTSLVVNPDEYQYAVVTPWYRGGIHNDKYIVSKVLEYMTPMSHFSDSCPTFESYYENKYNVSIHGSKDQPLLEPKKIQQFHNTQFLSDYKEPGNINNRKTKDTDFQLNNDIQCLPISPSIIPIMVDQVCEDLPIDVALTPAAAREGSKLNSNSNCEQTSPILLTSKDDKISKHLPDDIKLVDGCEELELKNNTQSLPTSPSIIATMDNQIDENLPDEMIPDVEWEDLEVRNISSRMNCLMPRAATLNSLSEKRKKLISFAIGDDKPKGFAEIFVPEFCIKQDYPGVLWYKAMLLPSVIHRVTNLLIAEELRVTIAKETKYGCIELPEGEEWLPIEVNLHIATNSMLAQVEDPHPNIDSIDRINNPIDQLANKPRNIISMKESVYQLQKKKISKEYPWDESSEPLDVERYVSTATMMDIECYDTFVSGLLNEKNSLVVPQAKQAKPTDAPAILPPTRYNDKIAILSKTPKGRGPEQRDILTALTMIKSHDTFNLERVETLGDAFLKFAASLYLFHKFPKMNEGQLTNIKCRLIGNRNLYYAGEKKNLGGRMKVEQFSPKQDFLVPGFFAPKIIEDFIKEHKLRPSFLIGMTFPTQDILSGELSEESFAEFKEKFANCEGVTEIEPPDSAQNTMQSYVRAQAISDKDVADCVEGLIGTYLLNGGVLGAIKVMEWMKIIPPEDKFASYLNKRISTVVTQKTATADEVDYIMNQNRPDIEKILNYKFKDPSLLLEAISHPSYIRNRYTGSYERLEFLGDALLDFLITSHIFENCGDLKPGDLTDLRSALVNNVTFASYVVKLGLHKYLCMQLNPVLENAILNFVEHQEQRGHEIVEDVLYLVDEEECQIAEYIDVPKTLSDIFESITGAIYLDSGGNAAAVWDVLYRIMHREIAHFSMQIPKQPVRVLYETIHACPSFGKPITTDKEPPKVLMPVTFTTQGRQQIVYGVGTNKSQAKRAAAKLALKILGL